VWGAEDRLVPRKKVEREFSALIPHARSVSIGRSGHLPQLEQPAVFNAHLRAFLARP
jgi:pimeloyl-ACP methyl ester carboxylesterase